MATVFQRCKTDKRNKNYPCEKVRCGHEWTVRYREPGGRTGRQREESFPKKTQAEAHGTKMESGKDQGTYIDPNSGKISLRAYAEDYLARRLVSEGTYSNYKSFIDNHLVPQLGRKTLVSITKRDIEHFKAAISKVLAESTVYDRMKLVKHIFWTAKEDKLIQEDPTKEVKNTPANNAVDEDEIPSLIEVNLIHQHISPQYKFTIPLQAGAGLRISEALAFHSGCIRGDFIRVRWQISSKAHRDDCKTRLVPLKHRQEGEYRDVPVAPFIVEEGNAHEERWKPIPLEFEDKGGRKRMVEVYFAPRERGKGVMPTANTYSYHFRKACKAAGLVNPDGSAKYTPHSLRHFFASIALANGVPIHEVSRWLGHKSIKTTVDIYGHLVPEAWDRCRDIIQLAMRPESPQDTTAYGAAA